MPELSSCFKHLWIFYYLIVMVMMVMPRSFIAFLDCNGGGSADHSDFGSSSSLISSLIIHTTSTSIKCRFAINPLPKSTQLL